MNSPGSDARDLDDIAALLRQEHKCHAAILYGSRARGDAGPASDYDVAGFADVTAVERITGAWRSGYLDIFVYPESKLTPSAEMLHMRGGKVLFQRDRAGDEFLAALEAVHAAGPEALPESELAARRNWAWKMLDRARVGDPEGNYRRAWLLTALLEDYFHLRTLWYEGSKKSLAYLARCEPDVYAKFEAALLAGAGLEQVAELVEAVVGARREAGDDRPAA
jgi:polymorphic toxin system nucleotidyltransferase-like protein